MCVGFTPDPGWKAAQTRATDELVRQLESLREGRRYFLGDGHPSCLFGGHLRQENIERVWSGRLVGEIRIPIVRFYERDTVQRTFRPKAFRLDRPHWIRLCRVTPRGGGEEEFRVMTRPAVPAVARYHDRMPVLELVA